MLRPKPSERPSRPPPQLLLSSCAGCVRLKSLFDAFEELCHLWCYAEDLESFETACKELVNCYALVWKHFPALSHV